MNPANFPPSPLANLNMINVVTSANTKDTGVININGSENGNIKISIAPRPAPAEIPSNPGSARLFLSIDCNIIPEQEREAPTSIAFRILGRRISNMIFLFSSSPEENKFSISENDTETLPRDNETIKDIIRITVRADKIKTFLDKN